MAGSQADPLAIGCRIVCDANLPGPASHDGAGSRFVVVAPAGDGFDYALDVERRDCPIPEFLASALGRSAMETWGVVEVFAKLLDVPAHLMLLRFLAEGLTKTASENAIELFRDDTETHWRIIGRRPSDRGRTF